MKTALFLDCRSVALSALLATLASTAALAAPTQGSPEAAPRVSDPVQSLLQLDAELAAKPTKANATLDQFREDLPLSSGKSAAVMDQLPLGPSEE